MEPRRRTAHVVQRVLGQAEQVAHVDPTGEQRAEALDDRRAIERARQPLPSTAGHAAHRVALRQRAIEREAQLLEVHGQAEQKDRRVELAPSRERVAGALDVEATLGIDRVHPLAHRCARGELGERGRVAGMIAGGRIRREHQEQARPQIEHAVVQEDLQHALLDPAHAGAIEVHPRGLARGRARRTEPHAVVVDRRRQIDPLEQPDRHARPRVVIAPQRGVGRVARAVMRVGLGHRRREPRVVLGGPRRVRPGRAQQLGDRAHASRPVTARSIASARRLAG